MTTRQLATLAWMVAALAGSVLAGDDDDLSSYRRELAQGRTRNAERRIRGLLRRNRSLTVAHRGRLNADLAGIIRGRGDTDKALKRLAALPRQCATLLKGSRDSACAKAGRTLAPWLQRDTGTHGTVALAGGRVVPQADAQRKPLTADPRPGDILLHDVPGRRVPAGLLLRAR